MKFDLVELLQYIGLGGKGAGIILIILFVIYCLFSDSKNANKIRVRIVKLFSKAGRTWHQEKERVAEQIGQAIDEVLTNLLSRSKASNALVIRFRNGSYDSLGSSILKFFASNEKARAGYEQVGDYIQNISRTMYGEFCDTLVREHYIQLAEDDIKGNPEYTRLFDFLSRPEKIYAHSLITADNQIIGFVCLIYKDEENITDEEVREILEDASARIVSKAEFEVREK